MIIELLNPVNRVLTYEDFSKLLLRFAVDGLMLFRGLHKLFAGIDGINGMLIAKGFPDFTVYGVLLGGVVAPCLIVPGVLARPATLGLALTVVVAWLMAGMDKTWTLDRTSVWMTGSLVYFFIDVSTIAFLGAERYSATGNSV